MAQGLSEHEANGVMVVELGLLVASLGDGVSAVAPHVAAVMVDADSYAAVRGWCANAGQASAWVTLACATTESVRSRCLALATLCGHPSAA